MIGRLRWGALLLVTVVLSLPVRRAAADLLPVPPLPPERSLWINFDILPGERSRPLPDSLRQIESGRLRAEEALVNGQSYRKTSIVLPLANGDRRETILLLAEEGSRLRMLGFHRILRHRETPQGTTVVFQSGAPNPLSGEPAQVPADTYSYLALCTALSSFAPDQPPLPAHLWSGSAAVAVDIVADGKELLDVLGTRIAALRVRIKPRGGNAGEALYWFSEQPPHPLLQYRGPGDFLTAGGEPVPIVLLRATASSEQVRSIFRE